MSKIFYEYDLVVNGEPVFTDFNREIARESKRILKRRNQDVKIVQRKFVLQSEKIVR